MYDIPETNQVHISHDRPCSHCGHAQHTYLACSDSCDCTPHAFPGAA